MINVPRNAALPVPVLQAIGLIGWALIVYLVYDALTDSVSRTQFINASLNDTLHPQQAAHPFNARYVQMPWTTLAHVIPGFLFMVLGPVQFISSARKRFPALHRWSGYVYLICALVVGVGAGVMGFALPIWGLDGESVGVAGYQRVDAVLFVPGVYADPAPGYPSAP
jgi:hypothetical protein